MKQSSPQKFLPYKFYLKNQNDIGRFAQLTSLSYGITQQLLFKYPKSKLKRFKLPPPQYDDLSWSMADVNVRSVKEISGWYNFEEYSRISSVSFETVMIEAEEGKLGLIANHPKSGEKLIIWPPEMQALPPSKLPEPGKKAFSVTTAIRADTSTQLDLKDPDNFEQTQSVFLNLAHAIGEPDQAIEHAEEMLHKSCLLLQWTVFEVFLKSTIQELIRRHPSKIAAGNRGKKNNVTYEEVLDMTGNLSSVESLRDALIEREIERLQSGNESVHGLINYLKDEFRFKQDPYKAWYVLEGEHKTTSYVELMEVKDVRNALIHDGGTPPASFFEKYPAVRMEDKAIVIDSTCQGSQHRKQLYLEKGSQHREQFRKANR